MWRPYSLCSPAADCGVVALDPLERGAQLAVRHRLDHLEVLGDEPVAPLAARAHRPDHPQLVGTAVDRLLEVGVGRHHRVDVHGAVDLDRREPHRQRHRGDQPVLVHAGGLDHLLVVGAEVVEVEGRLAVGAADLRPVQPPVLLQRVAAEAVEPEQRDERVERRLHAAQRLVVAPVVGDLRPRHPLAVHRQVEHTAARSVGVVELQAGLVEPHLQHARLEGDLRAAPRHDQRTLHRFTLLVPPVFAGSSSTRSIIRRLNRSASAAIVSDGLGPTGPGITDPSATNRPL